MVQVYVADITNLPDITEQSEVFQQLPVWRQQKIRYLQQPQSRKQSVGAGLLLHKVLARYGISSQEVYLGEQGKPEVKGLHFNLSHSGDLVVCAVGDKLVGCDVELQREVPRSLAERFFCEREKEYLSRFIGEGYMQEFFRLWTAKESYVKMTGEGMSLAFDAFEIIPGDAMQILRNGQIQDCFVKEYQISEYQITICSEEETFTEMKRVHV